MKLKLKELKLKNHAVLQSYNCEFSGGQTELWGLNGSGKTTLINSIIACLNGVGLKGKALFGERYKVIHPAAKSADIEVILEDIENKAEIKLKRHITASQNHKLVIDAPKDYPIKLDDEWLNDLLSESLFSAKRFEALDKKEQAIALGIDTSELDKETKNLKSNFTLLNRDLTNNPMPDEVKEIQSVDIETLRNKKLEAETAWQTQSGKNKDHNDHLREDYNEAYSVEQKKIVDFNAMQTHAQDKFDTARHCLKELQKQGYAGGEVQGWINELPGVKDHKTEQDINLAKPGYIAEIPSRKDIEAVEKQITEAHETNRKAEAYKQFNKAYTAHESCKTAVGMNKQKQKEVQNKKAAYVKKQELPFDKLSIDEDGGLLYKNREIRSPYFSHGEMIKITAQLLSKRDVNLKTVFIDDFDLIDEKTQQPLLDFLLGIGLQVIVAKIGRSEQAENRIVLSELEEVKKDGMV